MSRRGHRDEDLPQAEGLHGAERKRGRAGLSPYVVPAVLLVGLLCYSLFQALSIYIPLLREQGRYDELRQDVAEQGEVAAVEEGSGGEAADAADDPALQRLTQLHEQNQDLVGWLRIDDTQIDYPVMKSAEDDPEYYLHRDFDRQESFGGSLFVGGGCTADSDVCVIYGHHMSDDSMFSMLDHYRDYDFLTEHATIAFDTLSERRTYRVFSVFETQVEQGGGKGYRYYESIGDFNEPSYQRIVDSLRGLSLYSLPEAPAYPQQILLLSTCSYHTDNGRFVVAAYRVS